MRIVTAHTFHEMKFDSQNGSKGRATSSTSSRISRRQFLAASAVITAGALFGCKTADGAGEAALQGEPIIDIHQHMGYSGRADEVLFEHQRAMGISKTVLLPAGRPGVSGSTHEGVANGLQPNGR